MLNETVLYLFLIGLLSLVHTNRRYDFVLSLMITLFFSLIFFFFLADWKTGLDTVHTFILDKSYDTNIKIDIVSSKQNYILIWPFFVMTGLALINNLFFKYEAHKKTFSALLVLNLLSFILLIAGNNFIQIITFVFVVDIFNQLFVQNMNVGRRFSLYNLVADMGLFLVLAMLEGKLMSLDVGNISQYYETGKHRDFIMFVLMFSLFIKLGFFFFQGYWLDLKNANFHNLYLLPFLSTPMAALILFVKFYPLLVVSPSFIPLLNVMVGLTMLWGGLGIILSPQIKEKFIYFNMLLLAFLVKLIERSDFQWNLYFSCLLILTFLFNLSFYYLHDIIDREQKNKFVFSCVVLTLLNLIFTSCLQIRELLTQKTIFWILGFAALFLLCFLCMIRELLTKTKSNIFNQAKDSHLFAIIFLINLCAFAISYKLGKHYLSACLVLCSLPILYFFNPLFAIRKRISFEMKDIDFFSALYHKCILLPLKNAGVMLNILTDFIFLERTFSPLINSANSVVIRGYRKFSRYGLFYYFLCLVFGLLMAFILFFERVL